MSPQRCHVACMKHVSHPLYPLPQFLRSPCDTRFTHHPASLTSFHFTYLSLMCNTFYHIPTSLRCILDGCSPCYGVVDMDWYPAMWMCRVTIMGHTTSSCHDLTDHVICFAQRCYTPVEYKCDISYTLILRVDTTEEGWRYISHRPGHTDDKRVSIQMTGVCLHKLPTSQASGCWGEGCSWRM